MPIQEGIFPVTPSDFPRVLAVWEASVRATHHFVSEADIQYFKPLVKDGLAQVEALLCVRDDAGQAAGFIGVGQDKVEALFIHPDWRGKGLGRRLMEHAIQVLGATRVDVNEQNDQAVGFYLRMGLDAVGRSVVDDFGKPYPLLHMALRERTE